MEPYEHDHRSFEFLEWKMDHEDRKRRREKAMRVLSFFGYWIALTFGHLLVVAFPVIVVVLLWYFAPRLLFALVVAAFLGWTGRRAWRMS